MFDRTDKTRGARTVAGGLIFILATVQYALAQLIAAAAWHPSYSWRNNFISDLGNTTCGPFAVPHGAATYVCSPDHALMNGSFVLGGLLTLSGVALLWRWWPRRTMTTVALTLLLLAGVLKILVGLAPENTNVPLHLLGAFNLPLQSVAVLLLSIPIAARRRPLAIFGMVVAVVGMAGAVLSSAAQSAGPALDLGLGRGGMERVAGYPGNIWILVIGVVVIAGRERKDLTAPTPTSGRHSRALPVAAAIVLLSAMASPAYAGGRLAALPAVPAVPGRSALPSPVPSWPAAARATDDGPAGSALVLDIRVYLAGRDRAAEVRFATAASSPASPAYAAYLSPAGFVSRFGATDSQRADVEQWARSAGLQVTAATTSHFVDVTGSATAISRALATSIHSYSNSLSGLVGYAPSRQMSVPAGLAGTVSTVVGLDSYSFPAAQALVPTRRAAATPAPGCSTWWGEHRSAIPKAQGQSSAANAVCGYTPQQLRSAYGVAAGSGRGATIAVVLDGHLSTMAADSDRFFAEHHLPGFARGQFLQNFGPGFTASCGADFADLPEEPLDVETAHILAPAATIVYVAANCATTTTGQQEGFLDAQTRIVDHHLADVETNSFSTVEAAWTPAMVAAWTQIFQQGAVEGIGFNFDSGDYGDNRQEGINGDTAVLYPASDPWATAVGGTTTEIGKDGSIARELGWGDTGAVQNAAGTGYLTAPPGDFYEGSTGGPSALFARPGYQQGVGHLPGGAREVPDIAADASPMTGWLIGFGGRQYTESLGAGTSGAAPIIAALEADATSAAGHALGFANPLLYSLRNGPGIQDVVASATPALTLARNCENDVGGPRSPCVVTLGPDSTLQEGVGFDEVTGLGAPTSGFIAALAH